MGTGKGRGLHADAEGLRSAAEQNRLLVDDVAGCGVDEQRRQSGQVRVQRIHDRIVGGVAVEVGVREGLRDLGQEDDRGFAGRPVRACGRGDRSGEVAVSERGSADVPSAVNEEDGRASRIGRAEPQRRRELDALSRAPEQFAAEEAFEVADLATQRRLRQEQPLCGPAEVQLLGDRDERSQMPQLDGVRCRRDDLGAVCELGVTVELGHVCESAASRAGRHAVRASRSCSIGLSVRPGGPATLVR